MIPNEENEEITNIGDNIPQTQKQLNWETFFNALVLAHKIFLKTKEKPKIMNVTPSHHKT